MSGPDYARACGLCAFFRPWDAATRSAVPADGVCSAMPHALLVTEDSGCHCEVFRERRREDADRAARRARRAGFGLPGAEK